MIDSHCHLDHEPLINNLSNVIKKSKDCGIKKLLTICTTLKSFDNIQKILALDDIIYGNIYVANSEVDDFILIRSDGSPVYNLVATVDDHDMNISHVIRGQDHVSNTPKQILIYQALNWDIPNFAHLSS